MSFGTAVVAASLLVSVQGSSPFAKGEAALAAGKYAEALRQGEALVAKYPKRFEGPRLIARAALALDRPERAETAFRQALRLAPVAARPALESGLRDAASLRRALAELARARTLKAGGNLVGAAAAQEVAYRAVPARVAYGLLAAETFEAAGRLDDARRVLEDVRERSPKANVAGRIASLEARIADAKRQAEEEQARKEAEERRVAEERKAEEERKEAERAAARRAEEERQRAERERQVKEEIARLSGVLDDQKRAASDAEGALSRARSAVDDAERDVRSADGKADDARDRRDRAKRDRDRWQDKIDDAKTEMEKNVYRGELRSAESAYDDAKGDYDRAKRHYDDAKSRLDSARSDAESARRRLDEAQQAARDTEDAITRLTNG